MTVVATSCSARDSSDISAISFVLLLSFSIFSRISPLCEGTSGRARVVRGGVGAPQEVSGDDTPRKLALRVLRPKLNMTNKKCSIFYTQYLRFQTNRPFHDI